MNHELSTPGSPMKNKSNRKNRAPQLQLTRLLAEKARLSFKEFVKQAWHILEPGAQFIPGIQVDAICLHLQAVTEGQVQNLIINLPPGYAKSLLTAVFWPAWVWINHPEVRFLYSSYREDLASRDSVKCRRLIQSAWYQQRWGDSYQMVEDQNQKHRFENDRTGYRIVVPMSGGTGERGDVVVVDDPHSVEQAESDAARIGVSDWWNGTMSTRLNNPSTGHKIVVHQRLHEADLTGDLLARGGYEHLCLPAEFEPDRRCSTSIWIDPRTIPGELLFPREGEREALDNFKITLGSYRYAGQYQQRPAPRGGGIFKKHWWRYWIPKTMSVPPVQVRLPDGSIRNIYAANLPDVLDRQIQSWDMAFKDLSTSDYVVGAVWGAKGADRYLLDQVRDRFDFPETMAAVKAMTKKWPKATLKLVEDKANGPAVIQSLRHDIAGLVPVMPDGGKVARAQAVSPQVESGNVYLPHPAIAPWVEDFVEECAAFPNGKYDDQVDQMGQALNRLLRVVVTPPRYFGPMLPTPRGGDRGWMT
jgi:predicted phage terminase large subunit-like protein